MRPSSRTTIFHRNHNDSVLSTSPSHKAQGHQFFSVDGNSLGRNDRIVYEYSRYWELGVCTIELDENEDLIYSRYSGFIWEPQFRA